MSEQTAERTSSIWPSIGPANALVSFTRPLVPTVIPVKTEEELKADLRNLLEVTWTCKTWLILDSSTDPDTVELLPPFHLPGLVPQRPAFPRALL